MAQQAENHNPNPFERSRMRDVPRGLRRNVDVSVLKFSARSARDLLGVQLNTVVHPETDPPLEPAQQEARPVQQSESIFDIAVSAQEAAPAERYVSVFEPDTWDDVAPVTAPSEVRTTAMDTPTRPAPMFELNPPPAPRKSAIPTATETAKIRVPRPNVRSGFGSTPTVTPLPIAGASGRAPSPTPISEATRRIAPSPLRDERARASLELRPISDVGEPYPRWFTGPGLTLLRTGNTSAAMAYFRDVLKRNKRSAEGWYGVAGAALQQGNLNEAASALVNGYNEGNDDFPVGRHVRESCNQNHEMEYALAAMLVQMRSRAAYRCADLVLSDCILHAAAGSRVRSFAMRTRDEVQTALEKRAVRDQELKARQGGMIMDAANTCIEMAVAGTQKLTSLLRKFVPARSEDPG